MEDLNKPKRRYLTDHGIHLLREFLSGRGIHAVDIQIEFLDHYAILIEEELNRDRSIDFSQALRVAHKKAGGDKQLRKLLKVRTKSIDQYWKRRIRTFMKGYFEWPKIIGFLGISLFFFLITYDFVSLYNKQSLFTAGAFTILSYITLFCVTYRRLRSPGFIELYGSNALYTYQSFRIRLQGFILINVNGLLQLWAYCPKWFPENEIPATILLIIMSCIAAYELLLAHAFETKFQYWIKEELENKYPEHLHLIKS